MRDERSVVAVVVGERESSGEGDVI